MRRATAAIAFSVFTASATLAGHAMAASWTPDHNTCNQQPTTDAIMSCLEKQADVWDRRLNQAYQALTAMPKSDRNAAQAADLLHAQRLWLQYRKANCDFYGDEQGTIREVDGAECMRRMTQDRAIELQQAGPQ